MSANRRKESKSPLGPRQDRGRNPRPRFAEKTRAPNKPTLAFLRMNGGIVNGADSHWEAPLKTKVEILHRLLTLGAMEGV
jgi:hypothetical protein